MQSASDTSEFSPLRTLLLFAGLVFFSQVLTGAVVIALHPLPETFEEFLSGLIAVLILVPLIAIFLIRPMAAQQKQRKIAEAKLKEAWEALEERVRERTIEAARAELRASIEAALSAAAPDLERVLEVAGSSLLEQVGDICAFYLVEDGQGDWQQVIFPPESIETGLDAASGLSRLALETGRPLVWPALVSLGESEQLFQELGARLEGCSALVVPLRDHGSSIGAVTLLRSCGRPEYSPADQTQVLDLAERISPAIEHARLYRELEFALEQEQSFRSQMVQAEKFAAIGRMVASVAHELNNPLQTIKNCLYLLKQEPSSDASQEFLGLASDEIQRLSRLVGQLHDVYRPHTRQAMQPCDLAALLREVKLLTSTHMLRSHVDLVEEGFPCHARIHGIPDQIKQVFLNISLNAIDAMQPDGGTLRVVCTEDAENQRVGLAFHDSGPGISHQHLDHIFEPLYTTKEKGLGLGLSISYDIIHQHGGQLLADSPAGKGAVFTVWLPLLTDTEFAGEEIP